MEIPGAGYGGAWSEALRTAVKQLPPPSPTQYLLEPFGSRCALPPIGHVPEQPGTTAQEPAPPPRFRILVKSHLLQEDLAQPTSKSKRERPRGGGVSETGVRGRDHQGAIVTHTERTRAWPPRRKGGDGACLATHCTEGSCGTWANPWERRGFSGTDSEGLPVSSKNVEIED
ncbi:unnamed protein product [Rangifer tarandus platyrhynchus]|uniref:Uncharacterized protein n=2 Tax=Rangifer tarandus platyrhynchus TaxID=3082113 RepID=A0ACB0FG04_RANTA|nr:unnamed protein product [Rangifer tarandus platyrhynchus]CAI9711930.1 unnamed protein product [Rangifer tarandus platyrhynchus]